MGKPGQQKVTLTLPAEVVWGTSRWWYGLLWVGQEFLAGR